MASESEVLPQTNDEIRADKHKITGHGASQERKFERTKPTIQ